MGKRKRTGHTAPSNTTPLPHQLFIVRAGEGDDSYLEAHETVDTIEIEGALVGVYELQIVKTKRESHWIE